MCYVQMYSTINHTKRTLNKNNGSALSLYRIDSGSEVAKLIPSTSLTAETEMDVSSETMDSDILPLDVISFQTSNTNSRRSSGLSTISSVESYRDHQFEQLLEILSYVCHATN